MFEQFDPFAPPTPFPLSTDLLLEILDFLAVPLHLHGRSCDLSTLVACSEVCREWSPHAQRLLFRRIILPNNIYQEPFRRGMTRDSLPSFLDAIDPATERGRWLAESVVTLTLRHTGRLRTSDSTALATALLRTPHLRHLDVTTICCDFSPETFLQLRESGPRVTSLAVLQDIAPPAWHHRRIMHQLVAAFPSIRLLEITSDLASTLEPFEPAPQLAGLVCVKFTTMMVTDPSVCLASLMDPAAAPPLQVFSHRSVGGHPSDLGAVLGDHGERLRSLAVKTVDPRQLAPLALCTQLERFEFGRFPDAAVFASIPPMITELAISGGPDGLPGEFSDDKLVAGIENLPHLRVLTWSSCPQPMLFPALEWTCRQRDIELRLSGGESADDNTIELELRRKYIRI
ncbi:hypothetical protein C8R46DRAFT_1184959 [Mycena filopes]|nr:hypothetical protein C8R46DRAFT_1184959 [Mycena filopes]